MAVLSLLLGRLLIGALIYAVWSQSWVLLGAVVATYGVIFFMSRDPEASRESNEARIARRRAEKASAQETEELLAR